MCQEFSLVPLASSYGVVRAKPVGQDSRTSVPAGFWMRLAANRLAVAPWIGAAPQHPRLRIDRDAVGVSGAFVPVGPPVDDVAAPRQLGDRRLGKTTLDVQRVARLEEAEAARQETRHVERLLDVEAMIDQRAVDLHVDLRLAVGAHAAQHAPKLVVA